MRILLTGANGFVGKILTEALEEDGNIVVPGRTDNTWDGSIPIAINCLIHCARDKTNLEEPITQKKWKNEYETDVVLAYDYTMRVIKHNPLLNNIIFVTSIYGVRIPTVRYIPVNYNIAKIAERYLSQNLAVELAPSIRVNALIMGGIESDRPLANQTDEFRVKYCEHTLLGRMVQPDEIVGPIRFLVSDASKGMTGSELTVDGGYTLI